MKKKMTISEEQQKRAFEVVKKEYPDLTFEEFLKDEKEAFETLRNHMNWHHLTDDEILDKMFESGIR